MVKSHDAPQASLPTDAPVAAVACVTLGLAIFSIQDVILKYVSGEYPLYQVMVLRGITALPLFALLVYLEGGLGQLRTRKWPILSFRGVLMFMAYAVYYLSLATLPLATAVALFFTAPFFITALSVVALGEQVGPRRWAAVAIGFVGVLVIVQPTSASFEWVMLLPVLAAFFYSISQTLTRRLGHIARASTMGFFVNGTFLLVSVIAVAILGAGTYADESHKSLGFLLRGWQPMPTFDLLLLMSTGFIATAGITLLTQAYRIAPGGIVAPFEYTLMIWALLFGYVLFGDIPDTRQLAGMAIIIGSGLFIIGRERRTGTPTLFRRGGWRRLSRLYPRRAPKHVEDFWPDAGEPVSSRSSSLPHPESPSAHPDAGHPPPDTPQAPAPSFQQSHPTTSGADDPSKAP